MRIVEIVFISGALVCAAISVGAAAEKSVPFRDCPQCPSMVPLPSGKFVMGTPPGEEEREKVPEVRAGHSEPQHTVAIGYAFAIGQYDVTVDQFGAFVQDTGYRSPGPCRAPGKLPVSGLDWRNPGFAQTGQHPATCVTWEDAKAYTAWLAKNTGRPYRLPSEAEWEYAARAGSTAARFWGDGIAEACQYANVTDRTAFAASTAERDPTYDFDCDDGYSQTSPVDAFKPNGFGLSDTLGNVWQWLEDCWTEDYKGAPDDGSPVLSVDCSRRVFRGGAWSSHPRSIRSAYRIGDPHDLRTNDSGFRVALTLVQ